MQISNGSITLSASDLVGHVNCDHLTTLDLSVASGSLSPPHRWDPLLEILRERGRRHETAFVEHLREHGLSVAEIEGVDVTRDAVADTLEQMRQGRDVITQAALHGDRWAGRADVLQRVEKPSVLGGWSYEIYDTKLARETKAGTVLQLCLYADLLAQMQGVAPEYVYVVPPWSDFQPEAFRVSEYSAYYRRVKQTTEKFATRPETPDTYPAPKEHCDVCRWQEHCEQQRRDDDHLCLVAGITQTQIKELSAKGIATRTDLAQMPTPMPWKPKRGSTTSYEKAREQARIQIESEQAGRILYELLAIEPETGLCLLPEPSDGDVFFDIEGDPFAGEHGLEYLFGYQYREHDGSWVYVAEWATDRESEKTIFERFIDFLTARRQEHPDLHVYHFAPYEPGALKRLMGRYATRERELDDLLRARSFVDLYSAVRNGVRVGVESYSIKKLESLYGYSRETDLADANNALASVQAALELGDGRSISDADRATVQAYNADDCASTAALRDWLEQRRVELLGQGIDLPRPKLGNEASEQLTEQEERVQALIERLTNDVPAEPEARTETQHARWILAHVLGWHHREKKASLWEYFRLRSLSADELVDERAALAQLRFIDTVGQSNTGIPIHRYEFPVQETDLRGNEPLYEVRGEHVGQAVAVSTARQTIDIQKKRATADIDPEAIYTYEDFPTQQQADALFRLGEYVAEHGIEGDGAYQAARALLLREPPPIQEQPIRQANEAALDAGLRATDLLDGGVYPIQGPPGTGKSFTGARMICRLAEQGKTIGITANSHKVIRNLLEKVIEAAAESAVDLSYALKVNQRQTEHEQISFFTNNEPFFREVVSGRCQVAGATSFVWSRPEGFETLDVLVIDEAAQMSLANVLAVAQSAQTLILLGDPQQLDQPIQGSHPDGTDASALEHILAEHQTIPEDQGVFLEKSWRMHPEICGFSSELFYNNKLIAHEDCAQQAIHASGNVQGSGLRYLPVPHEGNQNSSIEEAEAIKRLIADLLDGQPRWTDRNGHEKPLTLDDILIITPYNAQVFEIRDRISGANVGTVDKFQGQEAPVAIYSMATSSYSDAPRGTEFLYSANRFNVAISRAKCLAILVASPHAFEADCKTPRQIMLANAFCRYLEVADSLK
ncbi:TM0106 family RecB-like putative nuclease [Aquisalimonas sp. 2447]|uniref:TM0106 family RecB-like putative nuclease n=1 Tax=Aquisalimonas sp. 2447 TaxID=2740807 RepID=UPI001432778B|nr:TM0106 family RecB-like putative nuclease [Aquisalimonas sp. 2447]QIT55045.1 TM0106 family RecB-like putative nuclease [Aquisalimonas sp. 2447]